MGSGRDFQGMAKKMSPNEVLTVLCTYPGEAEAATLATSLVETHLAACVNILPAVTSIYRWQGRTEDQVEALMIIKTTAARMTALLEEIHSRHPYEEPEIIALPVVAGSEAYLDWVRSTSRIS